MGYIRGVYPTISFAWWVVRFADVRTEPDDFTSESEFTSTGTGEEGVPEGHACFLWLRNLGRYLVEVRECRPLNRSEYFYLPKMMEWAYMKLVTQVLWAVGLSRFCEAGWISQSEPLRLAD